MNYSNMNEKTTIFEYSNRHIGIVSVKDGFILYVSINLIRFNLDPKLESSLAFEEPVPVAGTHSRHKVVHLLSVLL